jgi:succinate dehydrogenase hydrophobic anchor subunit
MPSASYDNAYQLETPLSGSQTAPIDPGQYIKMIFIFGLGLVGLAALFALAYGGIVYIMSAGSAPTQTHAKQWIWGAISGIVLLLCSYLILYTINPQLTSLQIQNLEKISVGGNTATPNTNTGSSGSPYNLETPLIGSQGIAQTPSDYVRIFFIYGLGLVGLAGLFGLAYGGLNYIVSAGSETRKTEGRQWIIGAVSGIALLLCSYLILMTINPQLISLQNPKLENITIEPHLGLGYNLNTAQIQALPASKPEIVALIKEIAPKYGLEPALLAALVARESEFNSNAVSPKGAIGLTQIMPSNAANWGINAYDARQNLEAGARYLANNIQRFGLENGIAAYNCGDGRISQYGNYQNLPANFQETKQFVPNVLSAYQAYKNQGI